MTQKKQLNCFRIEWQNGDVAAMQALAKGEATPDQQKRALDWIVNQAAATYQVAWEPDSERQSSFQSGRRFVGLQIVKVLMINLAKLTKENKHG